MKRTFATLAVLPCALVLASAMADEDERGQDNAIASLEVRCCTAEGNCRMLESGLCEQWLDAMTFENALAHPSTTGAVEAAENNRSAGACAATRRWLEPAANTVEVRVASCTGLPRAEAPLPLGESGPREWVVCTASACGEEALRLAWPVYSKSPLRNFPDFEDAEAGGVYRVKVEVQNAQLRVRGARRIEGESQCDF
jgi:hypothetical protein